MPSNGDYRAKAWRNAILGLYRDLVNISGAANVRVELTRCAAGTCSITLPHPFLHGPLSIQRSINRTQALRPNLKWMRKFKRNVSPVLTLHLPRVIADCGGV